MNPFDITEEQTKEQAIFSLAHILGSKDEELHFLPDLSKIAVERKEPRLPEYACPNKDCQAYAEPRWLGAGNCVLCGSKTELLTDPIAKESRRNFSEREKWVLIEEDGEANNARKIDVKGTHYENQSAAEIAMQILPLKGF